MILVFFNNDKLTFDGKQKAVCYYNGKWCTLGYDKDTETPLVGKQLPEINQSNIVLSTHHHSDAEEQQEGGDELQDDLDSNFRPDPTSFLI